jgi:hypothetical protein
MDAAQAAIYTGAKTMITPMGQGWWAWPHHGSTCIFYQYHLGITASPADRCEGRAFPPFSSSL